jgi:methyltransferase
MTKSTPRSLPLYLAFLALYGAERVLELAISRRNARRALRQGAVEAGRSHYPAMVATHALFLPACAAEALLLRRRAPGALGLVFLGGAIAAQALRYWAIHSLGDRWSTRVIVFSDLAPVTRGPYRYLKHPNYLAVTAEMACVPLVHGCWWTALAFSVVNAVLLDARIRVEERALGAAWARAFAGRPRLWPHAGRTQP